MLTSCRLRRRGSSVFARWEVTEAASSMEIGFDIEKYLMHSKKVDVSDLDFSAASRYPLTEPEIRCLAYMMDVESHTIVFLKGILSTCAITDPETTAFLSGWVGI